MRMVCCSGGAAVAVIIVSYTQQPVGRWRALTTGGGGRVQAQTLLDSGVSVRQRAQPLRLRGQLLRQARQVAAKDGVVLSAHARERYRVRGEQVQHVAHGAAGGAGAGQHERAKHAGGKGAEDGVGDGGARVSVSGGSAAAARRRRRQRWRRIVGKKALQ